MKHIYIVIAFTLIACAKNTKESNKTVEDAIEQVVELSTDKEENGVEIVEGQSNVANEVNFDTVIKGIKTKSTPLTEATNFDSFIDEGDYKKVAVKALQLEKLYPNFYKEGYNYRAIASYRLEIAKAFYSIVVTILKGDHEMESVLINYDLKGNIIDSKIISYDEIAEGMSKIESKIEQDKITINNIVDLEERNETIETFAIDAKGKITPINATNGNVESNKINLIDSVIKQLNLDTSKIDQRFVVSKVQPHNTNETIVIIPEIVGAYDEDDLKLNSYIVLVDNTTGKITHKYFESSKTNGWDSNAIELSEITIDTAPYMVTEDTRAFGIRVSHYGRSQPNPYSNTTISLFVKSGDALKKVLRHYDVEDYGAEWDMHCAGKSTNVQNTLIISKEKTNGHSDIIVKSKITESKTYVDKNGECVDAKDKITTFFFGTWCVFFMLSACAQKSSLRTQLQLLQNPLTNKYPLDSTGFSEIKKATFFTENGDTNVFRITSENAHLVDFNNIDPIKQPYY